MNNENTSDSPQFISLNEAAEMTKGTRITFIPGFSLYAEALKKYLLRQKHTGHQGVAPGYGCRQRHGRGSTSARLYKLTSQTGLPTMFHDEERPRNVWTEQLALAERIGAPGSPSIIPDSFEQRVEMFGLCAVVLGEDGLVWNMRILNDGPLGRKYGYSDEASAAAPAKIAEVITLIDTRLQRQSERGSPYLVGDALTAADIYWATMGMCVSATPPEIMPVTQQNKGMLKFLPPIRSCR